MKQVKAYQRNNRQKFHYQG